MRNWDVFGIFEYLTGLICVHLSIMILLAIAFNSDSKIVSASSSALNEEKHERIIRSFWIHSVCSILQLHELAIKFVAGRNAE